MTALSWTSESRTPESRTSDPLDPLLGEIRACRLCRTAPRGAALPHEPRPIVQLHPAARILIASQAPGNRAHQSGIPFQDPSGTRLRAWLGTDEATFYDARRIAILPMSFCFPGYDAAGGDRPPRPECMPAWRERALAALPRIELVLAIGRHAQAWHLGPASRGGLAATVGGWREILDRPGRPRILPLPHPSWRNTAWLKRNPWFETDLLPVLQANVRALVGGD